MQPKTVNIVYWISTILFATLMIFSAIGGLKPTPESIAFMHDQLGYPIYFIRFLSVAKLIGAIAILEQRFPRVKEWAYAGLIFDLIGAIVSVIAVAGKLDPGVAFIVLALALGVTSYVMWRKRSGTVG
jgi:DoxX-like family